MPQETNEVKIARMDEQMKMVREAMDLARDSRKQQYEMLENVNRILQQMDSRLSSVEQAMAAATPTLNEFVDVKLKIQGAGIAGKYIWAFGASIITFLFTVREQIIAWMAR